MTVAALAPIPQRSGTQSRNVGSTDPRGEEWMVAASSGQDDAEVGARRRGLISPDRDETSTFKKSLEQAPGARWENGYTGFCRQCVERAR